MTRAVATIIQAVSPEFNASAAKAEENGKSRQEVVTTQLIRFISNYSSFLVRIETEKFILTFASKAL